MSTVDKKIADDVIAGKYPEDDVQYIIKYSNMFDGRDAYKLVYGRYSGEFVADVLLGVYPSMINPSIYWKKPE